MIGPRSVERSLLVRLCPAAGAAAAVLACAGALGASWPREAEPPSPVGLRHPAEFDRIADRSERSKALFLEASRVLLHPRCSNCHPSDDVPRQGDAQTLHDPPVVRGPADAGAPALECASCHPAANLAHARVPGAPNWHLAPIQMAWLGKSPRAIAEQLKDPARNGGKSLEQIQHHMQHDALVAWGWAPGSGRTPAPGSQGELGALIRAWIDTGAELPDPASDASRDAERTEDGR